MSTRILSITRTRAILVVITGAAVGIAAGYGIARLGAANDHATATTTDGNAAMTTEEMTPKKSTRRILYWFDPMMPTQHFDKPGKSPFMDMELQPKYAEEVADDADADTDADSGGLTISSAMTQTLGIRLATVAQRTVSPTFDAIGLTQLDGSNLVIVQARTAGFVQRVYRHAPGETIAPGSPLVDLVAPEWTAAQQEYLVLRASKDLSLIAAARQRLLFLGMHETLVTGLEREGKPQTPTIVAPIGGVLQELSIRNGMAISPGTSLAIINSLAALWIDVAVPETQAKAVRTGQRVDVRLPSSPDEIVPGAVRAVLAEGNADTRTLRVRIELPNDHRQLQAGLTAIVRFRMPTQTALLVPSEAVIRTGTRTLVYVVGKNNRYRPVHVKVGVEADDMTVIESGLAAGERVVTSGQFLIDSEASLRGIVPRIADVVPSAEGTQP